MLPSCESSANAGFRLPVPTAPNDATRTLYVGLPEFP